MRNHRHQGFTLVEIMIVGVIIGLLASIAIPAFERVRQSSQNSRFMSDVRVFAGQIDLFIMESGGYPEDSSSGQIPAGLEKYVREGNWDEGTPIGGVWDVEKDSYSVVSAIGVHQYTVSEDQLLKFDESYDDGNLSTGAFRKLTNDRYYYVIAD